MKKILLFGVLAFHLSPALTKAQLPAAYASRLQTVLDSICSVHNIKGVSAAVSVPGLGLWQGVYGESENGVAMDSTMLLGIGSNTKTFVSSTMLKMQEQSLIDLDDTIGTWVQHPQVSGQITIRQLLNHTSGLYNYTSHPDFTDSMVTDFSRIWTPQEVLQHFVGMPYFAPGAGWNYSNTNYLIAGLIIRQVLNVSLSSALHSYILTPHGLNKTFLFPEEPVAGTVPHVWTANFGGLGTLEDITQNYGYIHDAMFSMAWAAGAIMSTAADNARFWSLLVNGQIVNAGSLAEMKQWIPLTGGRSYGLGLFRQINFNSRTVICHGGTNLGFINENVADSISDVGISVLTNQDQVSNNILLNQVVKALHKVTINPPTAIAGIGGGQSDWTIYPNPASDRISVSHAAADKVQVALYSVSGQRLQEGLLSRGEVLDVSGYGNGLYLLKLSVPGHEGQVSRPLVIRR